MTTIFALSALTNGFFKKNRLHYLVNSVVNYKRHLTRHKDDKYKTDLFLIDLLSFFRIIWGPSRDTAMKSVVWKSWPNLRPRIDHTRAETKVLRNVSTILFFITNRND